MHNCDSFILLMHMYIDGEATRDEETALLEHIASCPDCKALLDSYTAIAQVSRMSSQPVPPGLHSSIMAAIAAQKPAPRKKLISRTIAAIATAAAMLTLVVAGRALWPKFSGRSELMDGNRSPESAVTDEFQASVAGVASATQAQPKTQAPSLGMMMSIMGNISDEAVEYASPAAEGYAAYYLAVGEGELPQIPPEYGYASQGDGGVTVVIPVGDEIIDYIASSLADAGFTLYSNITNAPQVVEAASESLIVVERP